MRRIAQGSSLALQLSIRSLSSTHSLMYPPHSGSGSSSSSVSSNPLPPPSAPPAQQGVRGGEGGLGSAASSGSPSPTFHPLPSQYQLQMRQYMAAVDDRLVSQHMPHQVRYTLAPPGWDSTNNSLLAVTSGVVGGVGVAGGGQLYAPPPPPPPGYWQQEGGQQGSLSAPLEHQQQLQRSEYRKRQRGGRALKEAMSLVPVLVGCVVFFDDFQQRLFARRARQGAVSKVQ